MNTVEVDPAALAAEADAAVAGVAEAPAPSTEGTGELPAEVGASWAPLVDGTMPVVYLLVLPQWNLTPPERTELQASLAGVLDQLFPGGLEGKYACYVRLMAVCAGITLSRLATHGKLPPFGPKRDVPEKKPNGEAASAAN